MPTLSIIIVNYNTKLLLKNCLDSIIKNSKNIKIEICVVDNASRDKSVEMVREYFPKVKIIINKKNLFYSKANNQGLAKIKSIYFLILNPDTTITRNSLAKMIEFMEENPNCGLSSCIEVDKNGNTIRTCHKFHNPVVQILELPIFKKFSRNLGVIKNHYYQGWGRKSIRKVDTIPGSFIFGRTKVINEVHGFDENLPLFFNDADLCKRVVDRGYNILHNGKVTIIHLKAQSLDTLPYLEVMEKSFQDMVYYYKKHYGLFWSSLINILSQLSFFTLSLKIKYRL